MEKYEYIHARDVFKDDNNGLIYGVQDISDFPDYMEWFDSIKKLEANTKKHKLNILNRSVFLKKYKQVKRKCLKQ